MEEIPRWTKKSNDLLVVDCDRNNMYGYSYWSDVEWMI
jgi:hypothetical protein